MSGPKGGQYTVVSAEELRRRRLSAARDRFARIAAAVASLRAEVQATAATYGELSVGVPKGTPPSGEEPEQWEDAATRQEGEITRARQALDQAVSGARIRHFAAAAGSVSASFAPEEPKFRTRLDASESDIARVLGRLPGDTPREKVDQCLELAERCRHETGESQRDQLLASLRLLVQYAADRARLVDANRARVESLYEELDGLVGRDVEEVRGLLKGVALDEPLPVDLYRRVEASRDAARAERDRLFVLAAAAEALVELGYAVDQDFQTAVPSDGALIDLPHSRRHGVMVRQRNQQLLLNVVRYDETGARDSVVDAQAETSFCQDFSVLRSKLIDQGVELNMVRADPPGATPILVLKQAVRRPARKLTSSPRARRHKP